MAFSASDAAFEGFRLARRAPLAIVLWGVAYLVFTVLVLLVAGGSIAALGQAATNLEGIEDPSFEQVWPVLGAYLSMLGLVLPLSLLFGAVMYAAVNRAVLRPAEKGFGYMRVGGDELRVLIVYFVLMLVMILLSAVLFALVGVIAGVLAASVNEGAAVLAAVLAGIAAVAAVIWITVRLSLAIPMTVAEKRLAIFDSWRVTRGHFWGLLGMALLAYVLTIVVSAILWTVFSVAMFAMGGGLADLQGAALETLEPMQLLSVLGPVAVIAALLVALLSALQLAIMYAPFAAAYRDLRGGGDPAPAPVTAEPAADPAI